MKMKVYTKRNGESLSLEKSQMELLQKWFRAVAQNRPEAAIKFYNEIEQKFEPMNTTDDAGLVPTILTNILIDIRDDMAVIRPRATVLDMSGPGNVFEFNQVTGQPRMSWTAEQAVKSTTSITTNSGSLTPYTLAGIVSITLQQLQDANLNMLPMIISNLGRALVREEERAFAAGSGVGRPTGINQYSYRTVDAGGSLDYIDFTNTYTRLGQAYRDKAVWLMNGRTMGAVLGMSDSNNRPLVVDGGVSPVTGRPMRSLLGAEIVEQNDLESTSIFFIDLSQYYIGDKMETTIRQSTEATVAGVSAFERNLTHILAEKRVDAEMLDTNACVELTNILVG